MTKAGAEKDIVVILHYLDSSENKHQYAIEVSPTISYSELKKLFGYVANNPICYSRGKIAPNVLINDDRSLCLALKYFSEYTHANEAHFKNEKIRDAIP